MLRVIGNDQNLPRQEHAVASGTLTNGTPVVVNSDGTVSVVAGSDASAGSTVTFNAASTSLNKDSSVFDSNSNKVVMAYQDAGNSDQGTAIVGTINNSDNSISFGSEVVFETGSTRHIASTFDTSNNKVVIAYRDDDNSKYGTAVVGTVSGTSISFGTPVVYNSGDLEGIGITFDSSNNKVVISYADKGGAPTVGNAIVGTVSGTSISFGSEVTFENNDCDYTAATFDTSNNKVVISFSDKGNSNYGTAVVGTVSGTSISFGSAVVFASEYTVFNPIVFDSSNNKIVIAYREGAADHGKAVVGTVSGTSISFGSAVTFNSAAMSYVSAAFDTSSNKVVIVYKDTGNSNKGTAIAGTVSGTSISFGSELVYQTGAVGNNTVVYDSNANRFAVFYRDDASPLNGKANVFQFGSTNLTSENYIGIARSGAADTAGAIIDTQGAIADNLSGLTAGQSYYVQTDGTLGTTAADPSVFAGTAVSATELIVKG